MATIAPPAPEVAFSQAEHFAWWAKTHCVQSTDQFAGEPLAFEDWQMAFLEDALALTGDGEPVWKSLALVVPRKNGKTTMLSAFALYRLLYDDGNPSILLAASSDGQARHLFDSVASFVRRSPDLDEHVHIRDYIGEITRKDGAGVIRRVASDPKRLHGHNPSLVIADEVAQWTSPQLHGAWEALTTAGGARMSAQVVTITTAGHAHTRANGILGRLIDRNEADGEIDRPHRALTISRNGPARTLVYNYSARTTDPKDTTAIKEANPASWITEEFLARQAENPEISVPAFLQLHGNVWAAAEATWLTRDQWLSGASHETEVEERDPIALGFDGSQFSDATVLMGCRIEDGHLFLLGAWECPAGTAGFGWQVPRDEVDAAVSEAFRRYAVVRMYADPPYWQSEVEHWRRKFGATTVRDWWTSNRAKMAHALERFRVDCLKGDFTNDGSDVVARHIANARMKNNPQGYGLEKPRRNGPEKIDAAIASVLAYEARCTAVADGGPATKSRVPVSL